MGVVRGSSVTRWRDDPFSRGSWSVLRPGGTALVFDLPASWGRAETGSTGIDAADAAFTRARALGGEGPYVVQAAIAACHALAPSYAETDWDAVISWYDVLLTIEPTDVVRLGRASALAERDGPEVGLAAVDDIIGLTDYPWWHASRAELLLRLHRVDEAEQARDEARRHGLAAAHLKSLNNALAE